MAYRGSAGLSVKRLRAVLALLLVALALPSAVLIWQTRLQLRWESLHQYRTLAEEMALRIDTQLRQLVASEEARSDSDYQYLVVAGNPGATLLLQRSPLAELPDSERFPGLLGYFQIDADGQFSTPLLPADLNAVAPQLGLDRNQLAQRVAIRSRLLAVLGSNQLISDVAADSANALSETLDSDQTYSGSLANEGLAKAPSLQTKIEQRGQAAFDQLAEQELSASSNSLGRVDELRLNRDYADSGLQSRQNSPGSKLSQISSTARGKRKEQNLMVDPPEILPGQAGGRGAQVQIFESEVDPFEFSLLKSGHGVLYRKVWRNGQRTIQGLLFDQAQFTQALVADAFVDTALWQMSDLVVAHQQQVLLLIPGQNSGPSLYSASQVQGELLFQTRLGAPMDPLQLIWSINRLPPGPGAQIINWASLLFAGVLLGGFYGLYRLGVRQILMARQQQDFVSAVSHELKTPLTSIRMYAEMLREGWASEAQKGGYYDYIHAESERLSRLIANVLQLARMERNDLALDLQPTAVEPLVDLLRSKLQSQVERAGFALDYQIDADCAGVVVAVDADAFSQMLINLIDNAIKFSREAAQKRIEIGFRRVQQRLLISVRDYGPGIAKAQLSKIFQLFYRPGDELTRDAVGTGIGLALVRQLAQAMNGEVEAQNRDPGAELQLRLPIVEPRSL